MSNHFKFTFSVFATLAVSVTALAAVKGKTMFYYNAYDAAFYPKKQAVSESNYTSIYLDRNHLAEKPIDTLVFSPSLGFGAIAGFVPSATYPKFQPMGDSRYMAGWKNAMPEMEKQKLDPIAVTVKWCRTHKKEAVVALPLNFQCVHCGPIDPKNKGRSMPNGFFTFLYSDFQKQNPTCLMAPDPETIIGLCNYRSPGATACDFGQEKVRAKYSSIACEIIAKYSIDGFMVDLANSPTIFRSVASGGTALAKECEALTQMLLKIKQACTTKGVTLMVRVPDSLNYCKEIGIDLQAWLDQKIPDYVMLGTHFQLCRWNEVGDLVKKAGIPYGIAMYESGILVANDSGNSNDDERVPRNSVQACRARMADALMCKADSAMFVMGTHWYVSLPPSAVSAYDPKEIRTGDKRYFVCYTDDRVADTFLKNGRKHRTLPSLLSGATVDLSKGPSKNQIYLWDDFNALKKDNIEYRTVLITEIEIPSGIETIITFNGKPVTCFKKQSGTQRYELPPGFCKQGANEVVIKTKGKNKRGGIARLGNICVEVTFPKKK